MGEKRITSKVTSKGQTVIPSIIREKLGVGPGDVLRYVETADGILIEKARTIEDDPFATFSEWAAKPTTRPMPISERSAVLCSYHTL